MSAKSMPGKGSTFTFSIKFGLPTEADHPPGIPRGPEARLDKRSKVEPEQPQNDSQGITSSPVHTPEPKTMGHISMSPSFYAGIVQPARPSPSVLSSTGSDSAPTASISSQSSLSSHSSYLPDPGTAITLGPPPGKHVSSLDPAVADVKKKVTLSARAFSILVVCPLTWTSKATVGHLNSVLDHTVPHMVSRLLEV